MASDTPPARRHFIIEADESGLVDRAHALATLQDLEAVLSTLGGVVTVCAQRTKIDSLGDDPVAVTTRMVIEWRAHSPLPLIDATAVEDEPLLPPQDEVAAELVRRARAADPEAFEPFDPVGPLAEPVEA